MERRAARRNGGKAGARLRRTIFVRCVNGHCESTSKNIGRSDGLKHNALDGSWGSWSRSSSRIPSAAFHASQYVTSAQPSTPDGHVYKLIHAHIPQVGRLLQDLWSWRQFPKPSLRQPPAYLRRSGGSANKITRATGPVQACRGKNEDFKLCNINRCIKGGLVSIGLFEGTLFVAPAQGET